MTGELITLITLGIFAFFILYIGGKRGFFQIKPITQLIPLRLSQVLIIFFLYFSLTWLITRIAILLFRKELIASFLEFSSWISFFSSFMVFCALLIYVLNMPSPIWTAIARGPVEMRSWKKDFFLALWAWVIAFPLVLFASQAIEWIVLHLFSLTTLPDQVAVKYLKSSFANPFYFFLASFSIVIFAPLIEETLFRGFLQTFIRKHLNSRQAILITSFCFSLFHYSPSQSYGNISIIPSLFLLSIFLGITYEKRRSLFAPMTLHAMFNGISVINLYLFGGFTAGL